MKRLTKYPLVILSLIFFTASCVEDEAPAPINEIVDDPVTILGLWSFTESTVEIISIPEDSEITINAPNVNNLTWTFDEDNIQVLNPDTTWIESYHYDSVSMELQFNSGVYDVLKLNKDSLNLRIYSELVGIDVEFYTYFQLVR